MAQQSGILEVPGHGPQQHDQRGVKGERRKRKPRKPRRGKKPKGVTIKPCAGDYIVPNFDQRNQLGYPCFANDTSVYSFNDGNQQSGNWTIS